MIVFKDKTFCASPNCQNDCGHKMTEKEKKELDALNEYNWTAVSWTYFCGKDE